MLTLTTAQRILHSLELGAPITPFVRTVVGKAFEGGIAIPRRLAEQCQLTGGALFSYDHVVWGFGTYYRNDF